MHKCGRGATVLLEIQQALLGEVSRNLRAVIVSYSDEAIHFDCYFDGKIDEEDIDSIQCVDTELVAAFPETETITHSLHRLDDPAPIPQKGIWVYRRREDSVTGSGVTRGPR